MNDVRLRQDAFLEAYAVSGLVLDGVRAAEVSRTTFQRWRENDLEFANRLDEVREDFNDKIREHINRRAFGYSKPLHYKGVLTGDVVEEYSERMLERLAASRMPKEFRNNTGIEVSESPEMADVRERFLDRLASMAERVQEEASADE